MLCKQNRPSLTNSYFNLPRAITRRTPTGSPSSVRFSGIDGAVRKTFPSFDDLTAFERSEEYDQIQKMLVKLREKKPAADADTEPTRVITVRLPKSMHEYLRTEAHDLRTSMNKLCISKLLQVIEQDMIPAEKTAAAETPHDTGTGASSTADGQLSPGDQR